MAVAFTGKTIRGLGRMMLVVVAFACLVGASSCSSDTSASQAQPPGVYVSRPVPNSHVLLVPELQGGMAGWCLATGYETSTESSGGCEELTKTSTGPIVAGEGCEESEAGILLYGLTTSEVAAVSVDGGRPIPTTTNATLPDGLRAVAVEVLRHNGHPSIGPHCLRMTPLDANGRPIRDTGKRAARLRFASRFPGTKEWDRGVPGEDPGWNARPQAHGACELRATQLPRETSARWGSVATVIRPEKGLRTRTRASNSPPAPNRPRARWAAAANRAAPAAGPPNAAAADPQRPARPTAP